MAELDEYIERESRNEKSLDKFLTYSGFLFIQLCHWFEAQIDNELVPSRTLENLVETPFTGVAVPWHCMVLFKGC